jgi:hypothetical protein
LLFLISEAKERKGREEIKKKTTQNHEEFELTFIE